MTRGAAEATALGGLRVLELGDSEALSYAGKLLAEFGAEVVKVELPSGDTARRRIPLPGAPKADGALHRWINSSKHSLVVDWETDCSQLLPLFDGADVVLSAIDPRREELSPEKLRAGRPYLIAGHVSDFGPDGPLADWQGGELVLYALCGLLAASGPYNRPPVAHGTGVAWYTSGAALAVGVLVAHLERARSGHGQVVDVAGLDSMLGAQASLPFNVSFSGISRRRAGRTLGVDLGVFPCADGHIASVVGRDGWERLVALLEEPELMQEKYLDRATRIAHMQEATSIALRRFKEGTREHWFHGAQQLRMPFAKVQGASDIAACPQLAARGFFADITGADGETTRMPSRQFVMGRTPWRMSRPAPLLGSQSIETIDWEPRAQPEDSPAGTALPLEGVKVLELGTAWAGPCGTKILADLGADVIKIESPTHPDNARVPPFADEELGERFYDRTASFAIANTSKMHLAYELSTPAGQELFKRLVNGADVVFENYTPHVMEEFGLTYETLREIKPNLVMLSSCGYGHSGPWSDYAAYGWSLEPGGGIADVTGYPDGPPVASAIPYPDMAAALHSAFAVLLALEDRRRTGEGQWIDLAQYELAAISGISPLLQYQVTGEKWGRHGNRHPWFAPHNIYASKGDGSELGDSDSWLAIAIEDHSEWPKLVQALDGALENRPAWATFEVRKSDEDEIDSQIAAWAAERTNLEAAEYLQAAGVRAAPVNRYDQALRNPQPWHRGYLVRAEHQECGVRIVPGVWQRFERTPGRVRWGAPNFGAQNQYVLRGLLGMSDKQVARAFAEGETADEPTGLARPAAAGIPIDRSIELGVARGVAPGYRDWNRAGEFVHLADDPTVGWGPIPESGS